MKCDRGQLQGRDPAFPGFTLFPAKLVPAVLCPLPSNLHHTNSLEETFDVCKRLFTFSNQPAQFLGGWKALVLLIFFFNKALFGEKKNQNLSITCSSIPPIRLGTASSHPSPPSSSPQSSKIVFNIQQ